MKYHAILVFSVLAKVLLGQHTTSQQLIDQYPSHELSIEDNNVVFSTYNPPNSKLVVFDAGTQEFRAFREYIDYIIAPHLMNDTVYALHQFADSNGQSKIELVVLDTALNEISNTPIALQSFSNFDVTATPFHDGEKLYYSGTIYDSSNVLIDHLILSINTHSGVISAQYFDGYGRFLSHGLTPFENDFITWGIPWDSLTLSADLWVFRLNESYEIIDTILLEELNYEENTPFGLKYESIGKAHEEFVQFDSNKLLISGTSRSIYHPSGYQETNAFISYLNMQDGEYSEVQSLGGIDSNSFAMFSKPVFCGDSNFILFTTEGSSLNYGFQDEADTYVNLFVFDKSLNLLRQKAFFKEDRIYQRLHSANITSEDKIVAYGSEYSDSTSIRTFLFITDCNGFVTYINILDDPHSEINFYPNPSTGVFKTDSDNIIQIKAFDAYGNYIKSSSSNRIDLSQYTPGVYLLKAVTNSNTQSRRVILY